MMRLVQQQQVPFSQRLSAWTDEADRVFNHILGYVIAITSLVAFADVLSNGQITQYLPGVYWVWLIAQGLGVEFQVFILIRRLPALWRAHRGLFALNTVFIVCLCLMSIVIGSVFVQHDNAGGTIEQAMHVLSINHTLFVYARSALAILLVVIIAIDRALEHVAVSLETGETLGKETVQIILEKLAKLDDMEQALARQYVSIQELQTQPFALVETGETPAVSGETGNDELALEAQVASLLVEAPDLSSREIASKLDKPHSTVYRAMKQVKQKGNHA
jgi:hypothetical protein